MALPIRHPSESWDRHGFPPVVIPAKAGIATDLALPITYERLGLYSHEQTMRRALYRRNRRLACENNAAWAGRGSAFCRRYGLTRLVLAERHETMMEAISREKAMKAWKRDWKIELVERSNPEWNDLFDVLLS